MEKNIRKLLDNLTVEQTNRLLDEEIRIKINRKALKRIKKSVNKKISISVLKKTSGIKLYFMPAAASALTIILVFFLIGYNRKIVPPIFPPNTSSPNITDPNISDPSVTNTDPPIFAPKAGNYGNWDYMEYENFVVLTDYRLFSDSSTTILSAKNGYSSLANVKPLLQTTAYKPSIKKLVEEESEAIIIPEEINDKPVTDIAEKCFISLREQNISDGTFSFAVSLIIPEDSPYFTIEHPSEYDTVLYNKDKTTLLYACVYGSNIYSYEIPKTITKIYEGALVNTNVSIKLQEGNESYIIEDGMLMTKDKTILITCTDRQQVLAYYKVPDTVTKIDVGAFHNMFPSELGIIPVELPEGLKEIPDGAFFSGFAFPVKIPESVEKIGAYGLATDYRKKYCNNQELFLTIPENVREIGKNAFYLSKLKVMIDEDNKWYSIENNILYNKDKTELISANDTTAFFNGYQMPDTVKIIRNNAIFFLLGPEWDLPNYVKFVIPESVTMIEEGAIEVVGSGDWLFTVYGKAGSCSEQYFKALADRGLNIDFRPIEEY